MRRCSLCFAFAAVAGATVATISLINYLKTGLVNEHDILLFWPFADVERLDRWGALPLAIMKYWGDLGRIAESKTVFDTIKLVAKTLRLDMLGPLVAWGLAIAGAAAWHRRVTVPARSHALILAVAAGVALVLAVTAGRSQPVSFYRYTTFMLPIMLALGVLLCVTPFRGPAWFSRVAQDRRLPVAVVIACLVAAVISYHPRRAPADALFNGMRFAFGIFSIDRAYATQNGTPARPAYGGIYPGARGAYAIVGPHKRIWSMHTFSYCMLPDCQVETYPAFIIRDWDRLMFGSPEEGRKVLAAAGINYVLFSNELYVTDPLSSSPLFAPENIARHLAVRWTDGTTTLLTWPGPDTVPIDAAWVANYRRSLEQLSMVQSFPYETMRDIFARLRATPHPWRSFPLPYGSTSRNRDAAAQGDQARLPGAHDGRQGPLHDEGQGIRVRLLGRRPPLRLRRLQVHRRPLEAGGAGADRHLRPQDGSKVLDVGCGKAFLLYEMKKLLPDAEVAGFDISKHGLGRGARRDQAVSVPLSRAGPLSLTATSRSIS